MIYAIPSWERTPRPLQRFYPWEYRRYVLWYLLMRWWIARYCDELATAPEGNC